MTTIKTAGPLTSAQFDASSCLAQAIHDGSTGELELTFKSNESKHYVYDGQDTAAIFNRLVEAESAGQAYHKLLRGRKAVRTYEVS